MSGLDASRSLLVVVDMQERLVPAVEDRAAIVARAAILVRAAAIVAVPVVFTEHFPEKIGRTVPALTETNAAAATIRKEHFDACKEPGVAGRLQRFGRSQAVVCGTESHVCVLQTALGLKALGFETYCVADATGSRNNRDRETSMRRLELSGIVPVTSEMVVFEWAGRGGTNEFRALLALIK